MTAYLKTIAIMFGIILLTGCATIESKRGALLNNQSNIPSPKGGSSITPGEHSNDDVIWVKDLPLTIELSRLPDDTVLMFGPWALIPLPVIPWPPGIYHRFHTKPYDDSDEKVEVVLTFSRQWGYWYKKQPVADYHLKAKDVVLKVGNQEIIPSSSTYKVTQVALIPYQGGGYTFGAAIPDPYANSYGAHDGEFDIHVSSEYDRSTDIHLVYDLAYKDLNDATLEIRHLNTPSGEKNISPTTIRNGRKTFMRVSAINN